MWTSQKHLYLLNNKTYNLLPKNNIVTLLEKLRYKAVDDIDESFFNERETLKNKHRDSRKKKHFKKQTSKYTSEIKEKSITLDTKHDEMYLQSDAEFEETCKSCDTVPRCEYIQKRIRETIQWFLTETEMMWLMNNDHEKGNVACGQEGMSFIYTNFVLKIMLVPSEHDHKKRIEHWELASEKGVGPTVLSNFLVKTNGEVLWPTKTIISFESAQMKPDVYVSCVCMERLYKTKINPLEAVNLILQSASNGLFHNDVRLENIMSRKIIQNGKEETTLLFIDWENPIDFTYEIDKENTFVANLLMYLRIFGQFSNREHNKLESTTMKLIKGLNRTKLESYLLYFVKYINQPEKMQEIERDEFIKEYMNYFDSNLDIMNESITTDKENKGHANSMITHMEFSKKKNRQVMSELY